MLWWLGAQLSSQHPSLLAMWSHQLLQLSQPAAQPKQLPQQQCRHWRVLWLAVTPWLPTCTQHVVPALRWRQRLRMPTL